MVYLHRKAKRVRMRSRIPERLAVRSVISNSNGMNEMVPYHFRTKRRTADAQAYGARESGQRYLDRFGAH